jgi:hypothetical protein
LPPFRTVRRVAALAAPLALLAVLCLLALGAAGAGAKTRHSACGTQSKAHARTLRGCAKHQSRSKHTSRSHHHHAKPHHKHAVKVTGTPKTPAKPPALQAPAECEDGSAPMSTGEGQFSCADGSEPTCADGSEPAASHGKLTCAPDPETGQSFGEGECATEEGECVAEMRPICEDGGAPIWSKQGFFNCRSGEPTCETGLDPTFSSEGNILACESAQGEDEEED